MLWVCCWSALLAAALGCELVPGEHARPKSPGDNFYRILINGEVERYAPEQRYVVTLVGSRTHSVVQQFTKFQLLLDPLDPAAPRSPRKQGQFQLFADTLTKFDEECTNSVIESDDLPKTEVQVMWKAPPAGSGCVLFKAMVYENASRWFAQDGQLTKRICEDAALSAPDCCACDDAKYKMVFEGLWSPQTHPKNFPVQALWLTHFSDVIGATHPKNFSFWGEGEIATDGFRSLAEWGSVGLLERELRQQGSVLRSIVKAAGLWHPRLNQNTSATFSVDRKRHLLSLASMFGPSPDWVVGVSALELCNKDCTWAASKVIDLFPYDAGTDDGISYMSPNAETTPREKMYRITTMYPEDPRAPFYNPDQKQMNPMARLYLTREKLIARSCDEQVLLSQVVEEAENTESTNRPECAVSEWSAFSACSVTCGKGLRMRTREYRLPQKAQMFACDRQLVSKEMCVAAVPECEGDSANEADSEYEAEAGASAGAEAAGICRTSEWGAWSECSVTCGVGISTRRRHFLNQMGLKKCPLVHVDENRKCMQPQCTEEEAADVSDPACPTSDWAAWSPCSASCGRGVRFRTRLLLVPAEQQQQCAARVELMQQRACQEQADCTLDMLTAKRICMEAPEQGPCRGVYQRWAFAAAKGMCVPFSYGGCRGNQNNFISQQDCLDTCSVVLGGAGAGAGAAPPVASSNYPGLSISSIEPAPPASNVPASAGCQLSEWSEWSRCSVSCGVGYQQRSRTVLVSAAAAVDSVTLLRRGRRARAAS
ncbi:spondin-1 [Bicyclus anynana]|uniref:Spondin-1 n=1 Tax=Bicyclus anynana TaxID=110368 RepID=A0ABM3LGS1_BICAN|nr:spondin-1 [Bicyclus anynana]XP_052738250.1 spondin-1 [Bicyclus anynana]XP_052738252.1 spondin-1 [Bicyclus anynana]XP_052738253.1 spondin-1 [Bicyclus anynana]